MPEEYYNANSDQWEIVIPKEWTEKPSLLEARDKEIAELKNVIISMRFVVHGAWLAMIGVSNQLHNTNPPKRAVDVRELKVAIDDSINLLNAEGKFAHFDKLFVELFGDKEND